MKTRLPRVDSVKWKALCKELDKIHNGVNDAVHKGLCKHSGRNLHKSLTKIITAALTAADLIEP